MKITRNNYEKYFIDYLDGNLAEEMVDDFLEFIHQNPDLKDELKLAGAIHFEASDALYEAKENLIREKYDIAEAFDNTAIAYIEGDLSEMEKDDFENYLDRHPQRKHELAAYVNTKLTPDKSIVFVQKEILFHKHHHKVLLLWMPRIAAVLVIALLAYVAYDFAGSKKPLNDITHFVSEKQVEIHTQDSNPESVMNPQQPEPPVEAIGIADNSTQIAQNHKEAVINTHATDKGSVNSSVERAKVEVPGQIQSKQPLFKNESLLAASLEPMPAIRFPEMSTETDELLYADVTYDRKGLNNITLNRVARVGLTLVSAITNEKVSYETNAEGQITELSYDSRLLAFSIPAGNNR